MMQHAQARNSTARGYLPIENYGMIGDLHTIALVGTNGSIDWCCLPSFDAPSVFGALLDAEKGGFFCIAPPDFTGADQKQMYLPETNILVTRFLMHQGVGEIIDFMPIQEKISVTHKHRLVRAVHVVRGEMIFHVVCRPAFHYARDPHRVEIMPDGALFTSNSLLLGLSSPVPLEEDAHGGVQARLTLGAGQWAYFLLKSAHELPLPLTPYTATEYQETFLSTKHYWTNWLARCHYQGRWQEMVHRSALALKLLIYAPTGAIVAAPTTSLPEQIGGERNWDYRYTWLRDASLTIYSLLILGLTQEAAAFMHWLEARCHELTTDGTLQTMYTIHGGHDMTECALDHLEGYRQSRPVRIGNAAYSQLQLDIYGEVMDAVYL